MNLNVPTNGLPLNRPISLPSIGILYKKSFAIMKWD